MLGQGRTIFCLHLALFLFVAAEPLTADEWSWIDALQVADAATKQRLKTCVASASAHLAAIRSATFEFEGISEDFPPLRPGSSKVDVNRRTYRGEAKWLRGKVHYEVTFTPGQSDESKLSVLRTDKALAYTEKHQLYKTFLVVDFPPPSLEAWEMNQSSLSSVDPQILYKLGGFGAGGSTFRSNSEHIGRIESEDAGGLIRITFDMKDSKIRADFYCDPGIDYLPVKARSGIANGHEYKVDLELAWEWQKVGEVRYPLRFQRIAYIGPNSTPVSAYDLHITHLRVNESARVSESDFTLDAMDIPNGTAGVDRRSKPIKRLTRTGGRVRELRPGDKVSQALKIRFNQEQATAESAAQAILTRRWRWTVATVVCTIGIGGIILFLVRRVWSRMRAPTT